MPSQIHDKEDDMLKVWLLLFFSWSRDETRTGRRPSEEENILGYSTRISAVHSLFIKTLRILYWMKCCVFVLSLKLSKRTVLIKRRLSLAYGMCGSLCISLKHERPIQWTRNGLDQFEWVVGVNGLVNVRSIYGLKVGHKFGLHLKLSLKSSMRNPRVE